MTQYIDLSSFRYEMDEHGIVTVTMDMTGPVNAMNDAYLVAMGQTLDRLEQEPALRGVILTSAKQTFFAGGDIKDMIHARAEDRVLFHQRLLATKSQLRRLELLPVPVVAAINGAALGGGYEICLCCNYRIVLESPKAVVGLPEINLGLLPGGGGTVRLVRLLGLQKALPLLLAGQHHAPPQALQSGLVDQCVSDIKTLSVQAKAWILSPQASALQPWQRVDYALPGGPPDSPDVATFVAGRRLAVQAETRGLLPAPMQLIDLALASCALDLDAALARESLIATELTLSAQAKNIMTTMFYQTNIVRRQMQGDSDIAAGVKRIGIIGLSAAKEEGVAAAALGAMALTAGVVVVCEDSLQKKILLQAAMQLTGKDTDTGLIDMIGSRTEAQKKPPCDLIFDFSNGLQKTTQRSYHVLAGHGLYVGTGSMDAGQSTGWPARHAFFHLNAATISLIELTAQTGAPQIRQSMLLRFLRRIGLLAIVVNDKQYGFVRRVVRAYDDERQRLLAENIPADTVRRQVWRLGMPMTPAEADAASQVAGVMDSDMENDIRDRLLFRQVIESVLCLQQGILQSVADGNVASVRAAGAPVWTGGYLQVINTYDMAAFAVRANALQQRYGERFALPSLFLRKLNAQQSFH